MFSHSFFFYLFVSGTNIKWKAWDQWYICEHTLHTCTYVVELTSWWYKCLHCDTFEIVNLYVHHSVCFNQHIYMHPFSFSFKFGEKVSRQNTILLCWRNKRSESYSFITTITGKIVYSSIHYEKTSTHHFRCTTLIAYFFFLKETLLLLKSL